MSEVNSGGSSVVIVFVVVVEIVMYGLISATNINDEACETKFTE